MNVWGGEMKNRYNAEETRNDILNVATKLFIEKGYEKTSIQDIVNGLDGLTRGAIYHHFESKDDIINSVMQRTRPTNDFFESLKERKDLNGLEKIRALFVESTSNQELITFFQEANQLLNNSRFFVEYMNMNTNYVAPQITYLLDEANEDGSLNIPYTEQMSEIILLIISTWFISAIYPATLEQFNQKLLAMKYACDGFGFTLFDDEMMKQILIPEKEAEV